jgi:hypothetical protein
MGMTREEKEQTGKYVLNMARLLENGCWQQKMLLNAVHIIDEALELESVLDNIRAEIINYEGDCRLSVDEYPSCKQCTDNVFETIYGFFDKYKSEIEG